MGLIRTIIYFFIIYFAFQVIKKLFINNEAMQGHLPQQNTKMSSTGEDLVEDPNCHTYVPSSNAYKASHGGKTLYFCSKKCFEEYSAIQEKKG